MSRQRMLSRRIPFVLAAGVPLQLVAHGEKFFVESATGKFKVEIDDGNSADVRAGTETPDLSPFSKLVLLAERAVRGVIWVGAAGVRFTYPQNPPTICVPNSFAIVQGYNAGTTVLPGYATAANPYAAKGVEPGARRAFFLVGNRASTNDMVLYDEEGDDFDLVPSNSQHMVPSDCAFTAGFLSAGSGTCYVGEFFYA